QLLRPGQLRLGNGELMLQKTVLGWVVGGNLNASFSKNKTVSCLAIENKRLDEQLQKFWLIEECSVPEPTDKKQYLNESEAFCENHFIKNYKRDSQVSYGTASAAFLAITCLHQLAYENMLEFPKACHIIKNDFYMDDVLSGCDTSDEVVKLQHEIQTILASGGFEMRKWWCNEKHILYEFKINKDLDAGCDVNTFLNSTIWFNGPEWLSQDESEWPRDEIFLNETEIPEQRVIANNYFNYFRATINI
ncbi:hypothetical protein NQ317_006782, partial [Molorchus minor]